MEEFKNAVKSVCIVSAAVCLIENIISGTKLHSQMKLLLNLVIVTVLVSAFLKGSADFELPDMTKYDTGYYGYSRELYLEALREQTAENVSEILREQLTAAGINCGEIETEVNISEDESIIINRVVISADDFEAASAVVKSSIGNGTEVVNGNY